MMVKNKYFSAQDESYNSSIMINTANKVLALEHAIGHIAMLSSNHAYRCNMTERQVVFEFKMFLASIKNIIDELLGLDEGHIVNLSEQYKSLLRLRTDAIQRAKTCIQSVHLSEYGNDGLHRAIHIINYAFSIIPAAIMRNDKNMMWMHINEYLETSEFEEPFEGRLGKVSMEKIIKDIRAFYM